MKCVGRIYILTRWLLLAGVCGVVLGLVAGLFGRSITEVTAFRQSHGWMLYFLPVAGLVIVALYRLDPYKSDTNRVLEGIQSGTYVPLRMSPLIIISTVLTHAFGGSAGREGAALQLGGSLGGTIGKWLKLDEYDQKVMIMCGMSAAFSALFGTPLTATIFAMEVVSIGIMEYAALVPCAIASLIAREMANMVGAHAEQFPVPASVTLDIKSGALIVLLALLCAAVSILFCEVLHRTERLFKFRMKNPWVRVVVGALLVIVLAKVLGTTDYLGAGMNIVERAIHGETEPAAFLLKIIFTAITLSCGFKGGEIVPTLTVGAAFGYLMSLVTGLPVGLCASVGMACLFVSVTNCPVSTMFMAFELFGFAAMPYYAIAVAVCFTLSGYYGLYHSQKFVYSKIRTEFINRKSNE